MKAVRTIKCQNDKEFTVCNVLLPVAAVNRAYMGRETGWQAGRYPPAVVVNALKQIDKILFNVLGAVGGIGATDLFRFYCLSRYG